MIAAELAPAAALMTIDQAGAYLAVSKRHVERMLAAGELRGVHLGRAVRVAVADLDAFIELHRADGPLPLGGRAGR
jgi:excisionase family DNA binding protein